VVTEEALIASDPGKFFTTRAPDEVANGLAAPRAIGSAMVPDH